ncbi:MAG: hypothetical protein GX444_02690 [Myxococcales bacterium]|nr:hypothetical protein [Myxococcales bacterium]
MKLKKLQIITAALCFLIGIHNQLCHAKNMPIFAINPLDNYKETLINYADALNLDLSSAEYSYSENGFVKFISAEFEISLNIATGEFVYFNKVARKTIYSSDNEPISKDDIEISARDILDSFGVNSKEILRLSIKRKMLKSVEKGSIEVEETMTAGYLVYALRAIDSYPVDESNAKIIFNAEGELDEIVLNWGPIESNPLRYDEVISEDQLKIIAYNDIIQLKGIENLKIHSSYLAYTEKVGNTGAKELVPHFITIYSYDSFLQRVVIDATK